MKRLMLIAMVGVIAITTTAAVFNWDFVEKTYADVTDDTEPVATVTVETKAKVGNVEVPIAETTVESPSTSELIKELETEKAKLEEEVEEAKRQLALAFLKSMADALKETPDERESRRLREELSSSAEEEF